MKKILIIRKKYILYKNRFISNNMYMDNKNILKEKIFLQKLIMKMMITRQYNKLYELSQDENNKEEYDNKNFIIYHLVN